MPPQRVRAEAAARKVSGAEPRDCQTALYAEPRFRFDRTYDEGMKRKMARASGSDVVIQVLERVEALEQSMEAFERGLTEVVTAGFASMRKQTGSLARALRAMAEEHPG